MKKLIITLAIFIPLMAFGGEITEQEALRKAQEFLQGRLFLQGKSSRTKTLHRAPSFQKSPFYVFNAENNNGFVVVSADDRTLPILGYADKGNLDIDNMPLNAKAWLEDYSNQIQALGDAPIKAPSHRALGAAVAPLITVHWDQGYPYNYHCPVGCPTGCVATAMAQVMYYHKWPQGETAAIPDYDLPETTFQWDLMKEEYAYNDLDIDAIDAVAELMHYCGRAVNMQYGIVINGQTMSAANVWASDLIKYFGYSTATKDVNRRDFCSEEWDALIYNEVSNARPVLYSGNSSDIGHEFVIDGYDDEGLFHVNWGWGGYSDGYFALSILAPEGKGTGGGTSDDGFCMNQMAIVGIQPPYEGEKPSTFLVYYGGDASCNNATRTSAKEDFKLNLKGNIYIWESGQRTVDHAWALYEGQTQVALLNVQNNVSVEEGRYKPVNATATFGAGITEGTYQLRQLYRPSGTDQWLQCSNDENNLVIISINGNELTANKVTDLEIMKKAVLVNSCKMDGRKKQGCFMTAEFNWTNKGYLNETLFYVFENGELVTKFPSYVSPGETGDASVSFPIMKSGKVNIEIATDENKSNVVFSQTETVEKSYEYKLDIDFNVSSACNRVLSGSIIVYNEGSRIFNDDVYIALTPKDAEGRTDGEDIVVKQHVALAPNDKTGWIYFDIPGLTIGKTYLLRFYWYSLDGYGYYGPVYYYRGVNQTITANYRLDWDSKVANASPDGTAIIPDNVPILEMTFTNIGDIEYENKIIVNVYEVLYDEYRAPYESFVKSQEFDLQLAKGESKTIKDYKITGLEYGKNYGFDWRYVINEKNELSQELSLGVCITPSMDEDGISTVPASQQFDVYTILGEKVAGKVTSLQNLKRGLYIINGRKTLVK